MTRRLLIALLVLPLLSCGRSTSAPTATGFYSLAGTVTTAGTPIAGALLEILSGPNGGRATVTDLGGRYDFEMQPGPFTIRASKYEFADDVRTGELVTDSVVNFELRSGTSAVEQARSINRCQAIHCKR